MKCPNETRQEWGNRSMSQYHQTYGNTFSYIKPNYSLRFHFRKIPYYLNKHIKLTNLLIMGTIIEYYHKDVEANR